MKKKIDKATFRLFDDYFKNEVELNKLVIPKVIKTAMDMLDENVSPKMRLALALSELGTLVSNLNTKIELPKILDGEQVGTTIVTVNQLIFMWNNSGSGKDKATSTLRGALGEAYDLLDDAISIKAIELAKEEALTKDDKEDNWKKYYVKPKELFPSISTERGAVKQMSALNKLGIGAYYLNSPELGTALQNNKDMPPLLDALAIGYDLGNIGSKQVATEEYQIDPIKSLNINALLFSSINTLLANSSVKSKFVNMLISQLGRRGTHFHITDQPERKTFSSLEEFDEYVVTSAKVNTSAEKQIKTLAKMLVKNYGISNHLLLEPDTLKVHNRYLEYNYYRAVTTPNNQNIYKLALEHSQWRALKLSGILAVLNNHKSVKLSDYISAIKLIEYITPDLLKFQVDINKDPHELFVDYCEEMSLDGELEINTHNLLKLGFISSVSKQKIVDLLTLSNSYASNAVFTSTKEGNVFYKQLEAKAPTDDPSLLNLSLKTFKNGDKEYRKSRCKNGFKFYPNANWDYYKKVLTNNTAYSPYEFKDGVRLLDNIQGSSNLLVLDVDDTAISITAMHNILKEYKHIIATTSDNSDVYKYRIVFILDTYIDLNPMQWKVFYKSVATMLHISVDTSINKATTFFGYKNSKLLSTDEGKMLETKQHLVNAYNTSIEYTKVTKVTSAKGAKAIWDSRLSNFEEMYNAQSHRSVALYRAMCRARDYGLPKSMIEDLLLDINNNFVMGGIPKEELYANLVKYI